MNTVRQIVGVSILLGLLAGAGTVQAATLDWDGGDGAWETASNWKTNGVVVESIPIAGDGVNVVTYVGTARVSTVTGRVPAESGNLGAIRITGEGRAVIQTGGEVYSSANMWVGSIGGGTYELQGGVFTLTSGLDIIGLNTGPQIGYFIQSGGTATVNSVRMNYKGWGSGYIEVTGGELNVSGNLTMAYGGGGKSASVTQSGGRVIINGQLQLGSLSPISGSASVIVNLDGGEMTIKGATPLSFVGGTTNYFDLDGGSLYVKASSGITDFASLTAIANSDFRSFGVPAAENTLQFTTENIGGTDYTKVIAIVPPPAGTVVSIR